MAGGVADITDGGRARVHFLRKKHPDEEREEPAKDEARKMIIEEYANSLRELILHQKGAEPESCARSVPALRLY